MTRGRWRPSPGSVYPLLEDLSTEKLVKKRDDGRYELTPEAIREMQPPWGEREPAPFCAGIYAMSTPVDVS